MAYFDNAATTYPKPQEVYDFMDSFYRECGASFGRGQYNQAADASRLVAETRELLMQVLKCQNKQVVFVPSDTIGMNIIIQGLVAKGIKNIYISPFEHNAVTRTLHNFEKTGKVNVRQLFVTSELSYDLQRIKYQFDDVKPDLVILNHASNVCGVISPVEDIFNIAKDYNSFTLLDMAQTAGLVDFVVGLSCVDFAVFAGHKTLYGPTGISGFVMKPEIDIPSVLFGGTGFESANQDMPDRLPERFEMGTLNISGIAGLNAALKWIIKTGVDNLWKRDLETRARLINLLNDYSFIKLIGNNSSYDYVGIVSFVIDGISSDSATNIFSNAGIAVRTGLHCAPLAHEFLNTYPEGTIRLSVSWFTSDNEINELKELLEELSEYVV